MLVIFFMGYLGGFLLNQQTQQNDCVAVNFDTPACATERKLCDLGVQPDRCADALKTWKSKYCPECEKAE